MTTNVTWTIYGLMAEFADADQLVAATRRAHEQGYRRMEAYSPFPVEGLAEITGARGRRLPLIVLAGGLLGGIGGLLLQWYASTISYPFNVGGRPYASWPNFVPIAFETTILLAGFAAVLGMLWLNNLPEPYHAVFNAARFERASQDRFFLCIEASDPQFDIKQTGDFLQSLGAERVAVVEP
jgi:hypothetical protein